ncbi:MAG: aldo/keto reductase [Pseudomonadota bacterium]
METRRLGKTELAVSTVGLGTWQFSGVWGKQFEQAEVNALLARAGELGINFLDTAECYGPDHLSERLIGEAIAGHRQDWIIATKFGHNTANRLGDENFKPEQVLQQLEASLRALQTDYIDLYQLHSAEDVWFEQDDLWTMLDKQVQAGKVRFLGNSLAWPNATAQLARSAEFGVSVIQTLYNAVRRVAGDTQLPVAESQDLGVIARVPLASGLLSGRYRPGHEFGHGDIRCMRPQKGIDRDIRQAQQFLASKPAGIPAASWACAWCLQNPIVGTVIPGVKSLAQLEENAAAGSMSL